jgi:hypothetical protein
MVGEYTSGLFSPYSVPVAGTLMVFGIVAVAKWSEYNTRRMQFEERMAAIAKGLPMPEFIVAPKEKRAMNLKQRNVNIRLGGIICVAGSIGVAAFFYVLYLIIGQHEILAGAACALVPFGIGSGLLIDSWINARALENETANGS